jgi:hypothetical protein
MNGEVPKLDILAMMCWVSIEITVMYGIDRKQRQQVKSLKSLTAWQEKGKPIKQTEIWPIRWRTETTWAVRKNESGQKSITTLSMITL